MSNTYPSIKVYLKISFEAKIHMPMEILFGIFLGSFLADPDYIWQVVSQPNDGRQAKNECG